VSGVAASLGLPDGACAAPAPPARTILLADTLAALPPAGSAAAGVLGGGLEVYVDPGKGDDGTGTGAFAQPLRSLGAARRAVRGLLAGKGGGQPIFVWLRGGTYFMVRWYGQCG
jgi:hypothetical protein